MIPAAGGEVRSWAGHFTGGFLWLQTPILTAAACPCAHTDHTEQYKNTDFFRMLIGTLMFDSLVGILAILAG